MNEVIAVGALTDIGMRRATNQDAFLAERGVYVVCDGMGGETGGERASAIAVEEFTRLAADGERTRAAIDAAVQRAQRRARALGVELGGIAGTTISGIVLPQWGAGAAPHGAQPDAAITALYKEKGAFQVATLSPALPYALFDRSVSHATYEQQENGKVVFDGIIAMARENLANGIPVGLGTDTGCPYITHYDMWRELCYFVKYCGVTPAFALHTATLLNARLAGIDGETGSIEAGKAADLIVCAKDPLADLSALRTLSMVIKDGYRVEHPAPKKLPEVERELDKFL